MKVSTPLRWKRKKFISSANCSFNFALNNFLFAINSSCFAILVHWNGVKGFGTKKEVLVTICTLPFTRFSLGTVSKKVAAILLESSAIPRISSSVSVGSPSIKYNFTLVQPPSKARAEPCKMTSSVKPLLITFLNRCLQPPICSSCIYLLHFHFSFLKKIYHFIHIHKRILRNSF